MKLEPRPGIHMEKQFGWAHKLGGAESLGISKVGQTVLARLTETSESRIRHRLAGSVRRRFRKHTMASVHLDYRQPQFLPVCHWCLSSCYPSNCWSSEGVGGSICGFFKKNFFGLQKFLPLTQSLQVFAARSCGDLSSWHWNPGMRGLVWGWNSSLPR